MKSLLPLIACALIVGSCGATNFKLLPFEVLDKNNDGTFTDTEAGQFLIDTAKFLTQKAGKKLFRAIGAFSKHVQTLPIGVLWPGSHLDSMFDEGRLSEEDYMKFQDGLRSSALLFLKKVREAYEESMEEIEVEARQYLDELIFYAEDYLQVFLDEMEKHRPAFEMAIAKAEEYFGSGSQTYNSTGSTKVVAEIGTEAELKCDISSLGIKMSNKNIRNIKTSWIRQRDGQILTVNKKKHSSFLGKDERISVYYSMLRRSWLRIKAVEKEDEGLYECQVSTSPPRVYRFELKVSGVPDYSGRPCRDSGCPTNKEYREVDTDLDGNLSDVELRAFFEKNCKAQLASLDIFDANNDNVISAEEFVTGIKSMESMSNEAARHNWEEFSGTVDVTGDGMVSFEEVWLDGKKRGRRC